MYGLFSATQRFGRICHSFDCATGSRRRDGDLEHVRDNCRSQATILTIPPTPLRVKKSIQVI